jgi:hypothetical protein
VDRLDEETAKRRGPTRAVEPVKKKKKKKKRRRIPHTKFIMFPVDAQTYESGYLSVRIPTLKHDLDIEK